MSNFSFKIWMQLSILLLLERAILVLSLKHQSSLCKPQDMPCEPDNPEMCFMKYYKLNSTECKDMIFDERSHLNKNLLGTVELKSYLYNILSFKTTGFNVTFKNIKWKHLKFRFMQWGYDLKNTCREFNISENAVMNELFYDCLWSKETYEGQPFFLEYEASDNFVKIYRKFSFIVPYAFNIDEGVTNLKQWETLIYVELVSVWFGLRPSQFFLYWQPLPEIFSIEAYNVSVMSKESETEEMIYNYIVKCNDTENCTFLYNKWLGNIRFGVQPVCKNGTECKTSYTIYFQVGGENTKPFLIGITCITVAVPILWYMLSLIRNYITNKIRSSIKTSPKVLIIYSSSVSTHANVVLNLAEYLHNYCTIEPLVDELHISLSRTKDPFKWCNQAFKEADIIMIVASPRFGYSKSSTSIYRNTDALLLRMLRESLGMYSSKKKYFLLMMPYSKERDVPNEAGNLRKFYFPQDLNEVLGFIHGQSALPALLGCELQGGKRDYQFFGNKLQSAIEEAQEYLNNETESVEESVIEDNIFPQHKLLTTKQRNAGIEDCSLQKNKHLLKDIAKDMFGEYPGPVEGINLLNDEEETEKNLFPPERAVRNVVAFDINQLKL